MRFPDEEARIPRLLRCLCFVRCSWIVTSLL